GRGPRPPGRAAGGRSLQAGRAAQAAGAPRPPPYARNGAPSSARRAAPPAISESGGSGPWSPSWASGGLPPQGRFEYRDPVEQVGDEPDGRVVEREARAQALHPRHRGELGAREPELARRVAVGVDEPEGDEAADQIRVQAGQQGERLK